MRALLQLFNSNCKYKLNIYIFLKKLLIFKIFDVLLSIMKNSKEETRGNSHKNTCIN